jgi:hypothetical protein
MDEDLSVLLLRLFESILVVKKRYDMARQWYAVSILLVVIRQSCSGGECSQSSAAYGGGGGL